MCEELLLHRHGPGYFTAPCVLVYELLMSGCVHNCFAGTGTRLTTAVLLWLCPPRLSALRPRLFFPPLWVLLPPLPRPNLRRNR